MSAYDAAQLTTDRATSDFFEQAVAAAGGASSTAAKSVSNFMQGDLVRLMKAAGAADIGAIAVKPGALAALVGLVEDKTINVTTARTVLEEMYSSGAAPRAIVEARGLGQVNDDGALRKVVAEVLAASPDQVRQYMGGNDKVFGYFVGQAMKALKGKGNAPALNALFKEALDRMSP